MRSVERSCTVAAGRLKKQYLFMKGSVLMPEAVWNQPAEQPAAAKGKSCIINI